MLQLERLQRPLANVSLIGTSSIDSKYGIECICTSAVCTSDGSTSEVGTWYYPSGKAVPGMQLHEPMYIIPRSFSHKVDLYRQFQSPEEGIYTCTIPADGGSYHILYVGLFNSISGGEYTGVVID